MMRRIVQRCPENERFTAEDSENLHRKWDELEKKYPDNPEKVWEEVQNLPEYKKRIKERGMDIDITIFEPDENHNSEKQ